MIVGGGFAGLGCAQRLAEHENIKVTLIDRNNYHQFQPLLYQVATSLLAPSDIAHSLREVFADQENVDVKLAEISAIDPATRTVRRPTARHGRGMRWSWRPAHSRTSSVLQAPPSTHSRSTRSMTPPTCVRGSSACSSRSTAIPRSSSAAG